MILNETSSLWSASSLRTSGPKITYTGNKTTKGYEYQRTLDALDDVEGQHAEQVLKFGGWLMSNGSRSSPTGFRPLKPNLDVDVGTFERFSGIPKYFAVSVLAQ